jgi:hypothetical protein
MVVNRDNLLVQGNPSHRLQDAEERAGFVVARHDDAE